MINTAKTSSNMTNAVRINIGETWATDLNIWSAESRTWADTISIMSNVVKVSSSMTNTAKPV